MWEDPIFDPWSAETTASAEVAAPHPPATPVDLLRQIAMPRLEETGRRLWVGRHATSLQDELDETPRVLRFELVPWDPDPSLSVRGAILEIGPDPAGEDLMTAWYWLGGPGEAPDAALSIPAEELGPAWVERVIVEFVRRVLARR